MTTGPEGIVRSREPVPVELFEATSPHHFTTSTHADVRADEEPQTQRRAKETVPET